MDNSSTVSDIQETIMGCNATNMSAGCHDNDGNQTDNLFASILQITEITFTFLDVLNLLGNLVLMLLIYKASTRMEASGRLLMNQSVADAGLGLFWLVLHGIMYTNPHRDILETAILVQRVIMVILHCESGLSLAMTLFALHIAICNPVFYKIYQKQKYITMFIAVSWLVSTGTWCLAFAADDFFILERDSIIVQLNLAGQNVWFACLAMTITVSLPLAMITVAYTRICLFMHREENSSIASASPTMRLVRQAKGILLVSITYMVTFVPLFIFDFLKGYFKRDNAVLIFITGTSLAFLNYVYLAFKLPLFLLAFPSYRRVLCRFIFRRQGSSSSSTTFNLRGKHSQRSSQNPGGISHKVHDGSPQPEEGASSTPTRVDETIAVKGNIGRVNYAFTSTCSVNSDDTAETNGANVKSVTHDDVGANVVSNRPSTNQPAHLDDSGKSCSLSPTGTVQTGF